MSAMESVEVSECRRCGSLLTNSELIREIGRGCAACGYVTVGLRSTTVHLPLEQFPNWVPSTARLIGDDDNQQRVQAALVELCHEVMAWVTRQVDANPGVALQWLVSMLADAGTLSESAKESASRDMSRPYRVVQMMYAILLRRGPLDYRWPQPQAYPSFFVEQAYAVLSTASLISNMVTLARRGLHRIRIVDRQLVAERTNEDLELLELGQNIAIGKATWPPEVLDPQFVEAQKAVFGQSFDDLYAFIDPIRPNSGLAANQDGDFIIIDLERCSPACIRTVDAFTLTADRLQQFAAPYFFDLGQPASPSRLGDTIVAESGDILWLAYYPFLSAVSVRRPPTRLALTAMPLLLQVFSTAETSKAFLLHRMQEEAIRTGGAALVSTAGFARSTHSDFEKSVGEQFQAAGMVVQVGLNTVDGRPLACGEIDVLAAATHTSDPRPLVIVSEAKNVDLPLQKDFGYEHLAATMQRAQKQVAKKSDWVAAAWPRIADLVGLGAASKPIIIGMIVTRRPVPLSMLGQWPGAVLEEVKGIADHLIKNPVTGWRNDLVKGICGISTV